MIPFEQPHDERVEEFMLDVESQLSYLKDETRSLVYIGVQLQLEVLRELRHQRQQAMAVDCVLLGSSTTAASTDLGIAAEVVEKPKRTRRKKSDG